MSSWSTGYGFNFRATLGYVTDGTDEFFVGDSQTSPTTFVSGVVGGMDGTKALRGRNKTVSFDQRLAGGQIQVDTEDMQFLLTLPAAGSYDVRAAVGNATDGQVNLKVRLYDNTTLLATLGASGAVSNNVFYDATNVSRNNTTWVSSNASATYTFATTSLRVVIGNTGGTVGDQSTLAHFFIKQNGGGGSFHAQLTGTRPLHSLVNGGLAR